MIGKKSSNNKLFKQQENVSYRIQSYRFSSRFDNDRSLSSPRRIQPFHLLSGFTVFRSCRNTVKPLKSYILPAPSRPSKHNATFCLTEVEAKQGTNNSQPDQWTIFRNKKKLTGGCELCWSVADDECDELLLLPDDR